MSPPGPGKRPSPALTNVLIGVMCLIWGSTWLVIKTGLRDLPPIWSAGVRFAVAAAAMALIAPALARREGGARPGAWLVIAMALLNFAISYAIVYVTETVLPSGLVSVLWAVFPILQAIAGHLFLPGERLVPRQWLGFALGFVGVGVLFASDLRNLGVEAVPMALLLLVSPVSAAAGSTIVKRHGEHVSSALLNRNGMALGAVVLLGLSALVEPGERGTWTTNAVFSVAYLSIVGTVLTFSLYYWLLRHTAAHKLSLIAYVTPAVALTLGSVLGDESLTMTLLGGTALILFGVGLTGRRGRH